MQTGVNSIIAARIHSAFFAVEWNFMTLWLFTKLNSLIPLLQGSPTFMKLRTTSWVPIKAEGY